MTRAIPFDRKALQRIHDIARGVPRRINLLCDRAMLGAYAHGKTASTREIVEKAAREVFGKSEPNGPTARASAPAPGSAWSSPPAWR
jgi:general secretion pathway protein A